MSREFQALGVVCDTELLLYMMPLKSLEYNVSANPTVRQLYYTIIGVIFYSMDISINAGRHPVLDMALCSSPRHVLLISNTGNLLTCTCIYIIILGPIAAGHRTGSVSTQQPTTF